MKKILFSIIFLSGQIYFCQPEQLARNAFLGREIQDAFDYWSISKPNFKFHSAFRPYLNISVPEAKDSSLPFQFYGFRNFFLSKTFQSSPDGEIFKAISNVQLHPLIDEEIGYDVLKQKPLNSSLGGVHIKVNINQNFTFAGTILGGQYSLPFYSDTILSAKKIVPEFGQGYGKYKSGYSFFDWNGYVSFTPKDYKIFIFQLGRDKHFIGDGYRSLLLSDYAPSYPYFRINTNIWHIQYNAWYTWMYDVSTAHGIKNNFTNKFGTFHYLSYNPIKEINIGLFESIIWQGTDSNKVRTYDVNYLNPVIFFRPVEYSIGSSDNALIGMNLNGIIFNRIKLYGQLCLDEFYLKEIIARKGWWGNKQAWQMGTKYINAFNLKGLKLQAEYNEVRPFTYTHGDVQQNYSHYGMPLAHPLGANFREFLGFITYRKKNHEFMIQGMIVKTGKDTLSSKSNIGQNIFLSYNTRSMEYGNKITQGVKTNILQSQIRFTYYIIPQMNLRMELGYIQRWESNAEGYEIQNPYIYFAIKSSFWNSYRDF